MSFRIEFWALLFAVVGVARASATTLVRMSLEQLSQASTTIVRGHVLSQQSQWNPEHTQIITVTTIAVEQAMKGAPPSTVVVRQLGGTVGNLHVRVPGSAEFAPQTSYILFLEPAGSDLARFLVVGMQQGSYRIYRDQRTGEERVARPMGGLFYKQNETGGGASAAEETLPMREFRQQLTAALGTPIVIPPRTTIPVVIHSTEFSGVGRLQVVGRTTSEIYPNSKAVVPAGSTVEGTAEQVSGVWKISWSEVLVRGARVPIHASNEEPAGSLRGRTLTVSVR